MVLHNMEWINLDVVLVMNAEPHANLNNQSASNQVVKAGSYPVTVSGLMTLQAYPHGTDATERIVKRFSIE